MVEGLLWEVAGAGLPGDEEAGPTPWRKDGLGASLAWVGPRFGLCKEQQLACGCGDA